MSEISEGRRRSRAEILYCLDILLRHLNDEEALLPWLCNGVPDGTVEDYPSEKQTEPYLDFVDDAEEFEDMVSLGLSILNRECFIVTREHVKRSLT